MADQENSVRVQWSWFNVGLALFYCLILAYSVLLPLGVREKMSSLTGFFQSLGLFQNYAVFAPDPAKSREIRLQAEVFFSDGAKIVVENPNLYSETQVERVLDHRFRKLYLERIASPKYKQLLEPYCRYLAGLYAARKPIRITLWRIVEFSPPLSNQMLEQGVETSELYTYLVGD